MSGRFGFRAFAVALTLALPLGAGAEVRPVRPETVCRPV